ncbi:unnamed protein product, partial [Rotaria magnacalcarata]
MQACTQYRTRVLDNGSARRLNELFEAHVRGREKRQIVETLFVASSLYGGYKIIGDLFRGSKDEMVHRLDESENFQKHQEKLDDILVTSILSLEDNNLVMLKSFKIARNETTDLDSILPKVVGHARIENFVDIPTTFLNKTMDLYKITRLPLFVDERKAVYAANRPVYLLFGHDGRSEEWFDHAERK